MSTIKVNKIENTATADGGIAIDASGHVQVDGVQLPTAGAFYRPPLVINGAMNVAQRGTSSTSTGYQTVDRWKVEGSGGTIAQSQHTLSSTDAPYSKGFRSSLYLNVDSAGSDAAADFLYITQFIEAQNIAQSGWNYTSSSSYITLSFNVKSSLAGTYYVYLRAHDATDRAYVKAFTLTADTWSEVTCTVPGDSTLVFNNDNGTGLELGIRPYVGTNYSDSGVSAGAWFTRSGTSQTPDYAQNFVATASATFEITGVQIDLGEKSLPFPFMSYGDELARCQRYFQRISGGNDAFTYSGKGQGTDSVDATIPLCVPLRASPTLNSVDSRAFTDSSSFVASSATTPTVIQYGDNNPHLAINCAGFSGLTNNEVSLWGPKSNALTISAEL